MSTEMITNGSMEADANWAGIGSPATNEQSTTQVHGDTYSRHFVPAGTQDGIKSDAFTTVTGKTYVVTAWVYPPSTNARVYTRDGGQSTYHIQTLTTLVANTWNKVTFAYRDVNGGAGAYLVVDSHTTSSGSFYVDDVSVIELAPILHIDHEINGDLSEWDSTVTSGSGSVGGAELVTNGSMEADANWADNGPVSTNEQSTMQTYGGTYSRHFIPTSGNDGIKSDTFTTVTNKFYKLSFWIFPPSTSCGVQIRKGDNSGLLVNTNFTVVANTWNLVEHSYQETAGGASAFVAPNSGVTATGSFYVDDVSVREAGNLAGSGYGLACTVGAANDLAYGQASFTHAGTALRFRFYFDWNSLTMASLDRWNIALIRAVGSSYAWIEVERSAGSDTQIRLRCYDDGRSAVVQTSWYVLTDAPHMIEFNITQASSDIDSDATFALWVDGTLQEEVTGVDLYDDFGSLDNIRLGHVGTTDAGTSGTIFIDEIVAVDTDTEIGPRVRNIIDIDHESGSLVEWDSSTTSGTGAIAVSEDSGMVGAGEWALACTVAAANDTAYATQAFTVDNDQLRLRFYFDPNSITIGDGDSFDTLYLRDSSADIYAFLSIKNNSGVYQLTFTVYDDGQGSSEKTGAVNITDAPHVIEVLIKKATTAVASDGEVHMWIDSAVAGTSQTDLDLFDNWDWATLQIGARGSVDAGTSGTFYLDNIVLNDTGTGIGPTATDTATLVSINHGDGTLSEYDSTVVDGPPADLSVTSAAGLAGTTYGMQAVIDDTTAIYGQATITATGNTVRGRFYFDPNSLTMGNNESFSILNIISPSSFWFVLSYTTANGYKLSSYLYNDAAGIGSDFTSELISDAPHYLEFEYTRATSAVSSNATAEVWVDGVSVGTVSGIDLFNSWPTTALRIGAVGSVDAGTSGTFYLDQLVVNETGREIGAFMGGAAEEGAGETSQRQYRGRYYTSGSKKPTTRVRYILGYRQ